MWIQRSVVMVLCMLLAMVAPGVSRADEQSHRAAVEKMLLITGADKSFQPMYEQMEHSFRAAIGQVEIPDEERPQVEEYLRQVTTIIHEELAWGRVKASVVHTYMQFYREGEVNAFIEFYQTPAGQKMLAKMPEINQAMVQMSLSMMQRLMPRLEMLEKEFEVKFAGGGEGSL